LPLEPLLDSELCRGLRAGPLEVRLDDDEAELTRGDPPDASVTARMESMKRVGLLRLLREVAQGGAGYPLHAALEDMVVDWWLERVGHYRATPLTSPHFAAARLAYGLATRPLS
jgi:hypothetical protein